MPDPLVIEVMRVHKAEVLLQEERTMADLAQRWIKTQQTHHQQQAKRVYYLSLEYLIGRSLVKPVLPVIIPTPGLSDLLLIY